MLSLNACSDGATPSAVRKLARNPQKGPLQTTMLEKASYVGNMGWWRAAPTIVKSLKLSGTPVLPAFAPAL